MGQAPTVLIYDSRPRENNFEIRDVGRVTPYTIHQQTKHSDLGIFEHTKAYSDLDVWGLANISSISDILESFNRFTAGGTTRNDAKIKRIVDLAEDYVEPIFADRLKVGPSTIPETIEYLDLDKSAGFGCGVDKRYFVDNYLGIIYEYLTNRHLFIDYLPIWTVTAKDEVRAIGKLPRTIQAPPALYQVGMQFYFKKQTQLLFSTPESSVFRPGIALPDDWHFIASALTTFKNKNDKSIYFEWDGKTFDASQPRDIRMFSGKCRVKHLIASDKDKAIAAHLYRNEGWRLNVLPDGSLKETAQGLASGSVNTTPDNCISHLVMIFGCWVESGRRPQDFHKFVIRSGMSIFGDDGIAAGHTDDDVDFFRQMPVFWLDLYGVPCLVNESSKISDVTFLGFRSSSDSPLGKLIAVSADPTKLASSLVLKGKNVEPLVVLQQGVAHRRMYSRFRLNTPDAIPMCDALDLDLQNYIASLKPNYLGDPEFTILEHFATCDWRTLLGENVDDGIIRELRKELK